MELSLGLTKALLGKMTERDKFSSYLPYIAYDPVTHVYHNADGSRGLLWECVPLWFAGEATARTLTGLFRAGIPEGSVMQFILYADPYIKPIMDRFASLHATEDPLLKRSMEEYTKFILGGTEGLDNFSGIPVRNFRLFVSMNIPENADVKFEELKASVYDILVGARLFPQRLDPNELVRTLYRIFNDRFPEHLAYDEKKEIREQVISGETVITNEMSCLKLGSRVCRTITPKTLPAESSLLTANIITGDIWGVQSDNNQIKSPFLITYNVIFENLKTKIGARASVVMQQQAIGSFVPSVVRRKEEFMWAVDEMEKGESFFRIIPIVVMFGKNEEDARDSTVRVKRIWEDRGFVMQEDRGIIPILFLSSLPFGLYNTGDNVKMLDRDFIVPTETLAEMLPVQADFQGSGEPKILFVGRKGQLSGIDLFDFKAPNMNALIAASSGGGKSFLMNHIIIPNLSSGAYVRIIDIGRSYKKACALFNGKFIEFTADSTICLNPFTNIIAEDLDNELFTISSIILQMVYSFTDMRPNELEASLVKSTVRWAYQNEGQDATIDTVYRCLAEYGSMNAPRPEDIKAGDRELAAIASKIAFNLKEFTKEGAYGKWFYGKANLNIKNDRFVVLELEELQSRKELFKVVVLQVLNYVTQDLYLSDRSSPRMVIFDEAWQFFKMGGFLLDIIEDGDRRARKYKGSFTKVVQSLLDLRRFREIGDVILNNSAFKFYPQSSDFEKARNEKILDCDQLKFEILKSVKLNRPKYSEVYVETPVGEGVVRLVVNPFLYYLYTSDANDNFRIEQMVKNEGKSYLEAIEILAGQREASK